MVENSILGVWKMGYILASYLWLVFHDRYRISRWQEVAYSIIQHLRQARMHISPSIEIERFYR